MDSPYLSLVSLVRSWPQQKVRREVLMISDGIDRLRGDTTGTTAGRSAVARRTAMPTISLDADTASRNSQRYAVIVHSIYSPGIGRLSRNAWEAQLGQGGVAKIAGETGGEYFALGQQNAVSFKPYLERLQKIFDNQYFLVLQVPPRKKEGLQQVRITTTLANADIAPANNGSCCRRLVRHRHKTLQSSRNMSARHLANGFNSIEIFLKGGHSSDEGN